MSLLEGWRVGGLEGWRNHLTKPSQKVKKKRNGLAVFEPSHHLKKSKKKGETAPP
jgi:hypothetical protein